MQQVTQTESIDIRPDWLRKIGAAAALTAGTLLLIGTVSLIVSVSQPGAGSGWLLYLQNNWLLVIFKLHAQFKGLTADLHGLNFLDIGFLILVGLLCLSLSSGFSKAARVWALITSALSLIAIILYSATQIAGRSAVMLVVLIISVVILKDRHFRKGTSMIGILAGVLLFVGDLTVGMQSSMITVLFGIGYLLLVIWFFLIAQGLLRPDRQP
jgi:hypothetical protein